MKGIILAAGYGTRLKEYGEAVPKGLIPHNNSFLVSHVLQEFISCGIQSMTMITNDKYLKTYQSFLSTTPYQVKIISDGTDKAENRLGGLGDLLYVTQQPGWVHENCLVAPSDTYFEFSFTDFLGFTSLHPDGFCTVVRQLPIAEIAGRLGCVTIEADRIISFIEKPPHPVSPYAAIPFYYYPAQIMSLLSVYQQEGNSMDAPGSFIPWLLSRQLPVFAYQVSSRTLDVGTMSDVSTLKCLS